ncbi:hypothetical protein [Zunongwangia endophytica]|uniref:Uncharacterized protein n=1 Tax=Zunongwangia endophytica TaxID=1808945 RepID=A0ABV8H726_9FLAO|nr:hypothetical protein [Zunongwangia endophytica]MDN3595787.1 hypothetical protein [Zunongwangia endophytica]
MTKFLSIIAIVAISALKTSAQTYTGTVKDSANAPLHGAKLITIPDSNNLNMAFSLFVQ